MKILRYNFIISIIVSFIIYLIKSFVMWEIRNPITLWTDFGTLDPGTRGCIVMAYIFYQIVVIIMISQSVYEEEKEKLKTT